jgi:hypothetical protein
MVIDRRRNGLSVPLLLSALANAMFWDHHCLTVRGIDSLQAKRVLRLEFTPPLDAKDGDWVGTAFVDSAASVSHRIEFQLVGLRDDDVHVGSTATRRSVHPRPSS